VPDRDCADAIFYVRRTGCQWQALDQTELCAHSTAHDRFQEWVKAGVFLKLWQAGLEQVDELCGLDWQWLSMDGVMTKAPLGGEKNRPQSHGSRQEWRQTQPASARAWGANWSDD
jgi:transposase